MENIMASPLAYDVDQALNANRIFVALDVPNTSEALTLVEKLAPLGLSFKIGMQLFYAEGMPLVKKVQKFLDQQSPANAGDIFVDLKLHDIPNTVAKASEALTAQGVTFFNLHTLGGQEMMRAAADSVQKTAEKLNIKKPTLIGVTVLTSHSPESLSSDLLVSSKLDSYVLHLAKLAKECHLDGVVCSAQEASVIRDACGEKFLKVTPGIRLPENNRDDQSRVLTPEAAFEAGATHLVVGRPITQANDPVVAAQAVLANAGIHS